MMVIDSTPNISKRIPIAFVFHISDGKPSDIEIANLFIKNSLFFCFIVDVSIYVIDYFFAAGPIHNGNITQNQLQSITCVNFKIKNTLKTKIHYKEK